LFVCASTLFHAAQKVRADQSATVLAESMWLTSSKKIRSEHTGQQAELRFFFGRVRNLPDRFIFDGVQVHSIGLEFGESVNDANHEGLTP
jgi:hypothetical protein